MNFINDCFKTLFRNLNEMFFFHSDHYGGDVISNEALKVMGDPIKWEKVEKQIQEIREGKREIIEI